MLVVGGSGKKQTFTGPEVAALLDLFHEWFARESAKALVAGEKFTQENAGEALATTQQTAGKLINRKVESSGISRPVGTAIVRLMGYQGTDHFFAVRGLEEQAPDTDPCPNRARALHRLAGLLSEGAIESVRAEKFGPEGDLPEAEWCRRALDAQYQHDRLRLYDRPTTVPPKRKSDVRRVSGRKGHG